MRDICVWAYNADFGLLCANAQLDSGSGLAYPAGNEKGQAGWHVAVKFRNLRELADWFSKGVLMPKQFCGKWFRDCDTIARGEIVRLAILAHGDQGGKLLIDGRDHPPMTADNVQSFHSDLHTVGLYTRENGSTILFMGCLAGQADAGTHLLQALSRIWPGRRVVGFSTVGYRHPGAMKRPGEPCENVGMRDTDATDSLYANPMRFDTMWSDFAKMPWAAENSVHAKVVYKEKVERCPPDELCNRSQRH